MEILSRRRGIAWMVSGLAMTGVAAAETGETIDMQRNFVACPIVLDTSPVPCWVADYEGERYFLAVQSGRGAGGTTLPPQLRHKALIQGTVTDEPRVCGGIVLKPVMLAPIMEELDESCNSLLPSGGYHATGPRVIGLDGDPPGSRETTAFEAAYGQRKGLKERRELYARNAAERKRMDFDITFSLNSDYIVYPIEQEDVEDAVDYAVQMKASRLEITGYRSSSLLSNGDKLIEKDNLAQQRAEKLALIVKDFGWPAEKLVVRWEDKPVTNGGIRDYELRHAVIAVMP